jgi:outer membrane receptor protein involved in Fe transport
VTVRYRSFVNILLRSSAAWVLALLLGIPAASAQVTGSVAGTVRDASGGVLPGATITLKGPSLQRESVSATSAADGTYRLLLIPPGTYAVTIELAGFQSQERQAVDVALNQQTTLDAVLGVAGRAEQVSVTSDVPLVEVTRSDLGTRVTGRTIDALPLNGRNFTDLVGLVPGATPNPAAVSGANVSIFGERAGAVSYLVDGAENNDPVSGGALLRYTQDSIREFEVVTSGYEAEFGRAQGGVANIITRSGTNGFDGRAFWFGRNDRFDSNNIPDPSPLPAGYVRPEPPQLERNQWGGTLGGPIRKDTAFFFGSFEKLNESRGVNINQAAIPAFILSGVATPSHTEDFSIAPKTDGFTGLGKVDVNLNGSNRLTGSVNRSTNTNSGLISSPVAGTVALPSAARREERPGTSVVFRETALLSPSTYLESTGTYVRGENGTNLDQTGRSEPVLLLLASGFFQTGAPFGGQSDRQSQRYQFAQSLTHSVTNMHGDHQFKAGWDFNHVALTGYDQVSNDVEYSAAFLSPSAAAINQDLFNRLGFQQSAARFFTLSAAADGNLNLDIKSNDFSAFAQDTWQLRPGVTINAGVRYDYASLFGGAKGNIGPRIGVAWDVNNTHKTIVKANYGLFFDRNLLAAAATVPEKGGIFTKSAFDVALPRLGSDYTDSLIDLVITSGFPTATGRSPAENPLYAKFASDLRADPLALYKALGIPVPNPSVPPVVTADNIQQLSGMSAAQAVALLDSRYPGTDFRFFDVPGGSRVGDRVLSFFPRGPLEVTRTVSQYDSDKTPYTNAFSVGVDQQLAADFTVSVQYVHRRTRDLLTRRITNLFDAAPGDANFGKTTDGGAQISEVTYDGLINYDGVIVALHKRFSARYQVGLSYTGSRARDNLLTGDVGSTFANNNHPEDDYGPSNQSAPHVFVANGLYVAPFDIHVSGIVYWRSGSAFNPRGIIDSDGDGLVDQRDLTQPRNAFRVKAYGDVDVRVEKRFPFGKSSATVLVEAFNLFNRDNVANVNAVSGATFGTPSTYLPGREVQFGVRYLFGQ